MIERKLVSRVRGSLDRFPAVALLGPRQVGKTTLAKTSLDVPHVYLDLESPSDLAKLEDAEGYLRMHAGKLVVLDEVQRKPGIFQILRGLIDQRVLSGDGAGQYLLLGSASIDLLKQSSETLAGRIAYLELGGLRADEVDRDAVTNLWNRGGFPPSLLARSDAESADWRENFIRSYLERDIPALGPRVPSETLRRFWTMLAHRQGSPLNAAELARSLSVDATTVARYLDLLVDLLLVRRLMPVHSNTGKRLVKSPKTYVRDCGLTHTLLRLDTTDAVLGHPVAGSSWEGFVIENLLAASPPRTDSGFYRTATGSEADLVLDMPNGRRWAVEIKLGTDPTLGRGFWNAIEDLRPDRAFVVYGGSERYPKGKGVEAVGLPELMSELSHQA
jgi:predicted AAA+ superfamily ATPase